MEWAERPERAPEIFVVSVMRISRGHDRVEETPLEAEEDLTDHHLTIPETEVEVLKINLIHPSDQDLETIPMLILQINVSRL